MTQDDDNRPLRMNDIRGCFDELGKNLGASLTASLTKDFTKAVSVVGDQVNSNKKEIENLKQQLTEISGRSKDEQEKLEERLRRIETLVTEGHQRQRLGGTLDENGSSGLDMTIDIQARTSNVINHERYLTARRSIRCWPVPGDNDADL